MLEIGEKLGYFLFGEIVGFLFAVILIDFIEKCKRRKWWLT